MRLELIYARQALKQLGLMAGDAVAFHQIGPPQEREIDIRRITFLASEHEGRANPNFITCKVERVSEAEGNWRVSIESDHVPMLKTAARDAIDVIRQVREYAASQRCHLGDVVSIRLTNGVWSAVFEKGGLSDEEFGSHFLRFFRIDDVSGEFLPVVAKPN
jgi:hypothetical protein